MGKFHRELEAARVLLVTSFHLSCLTAVSAESGFAMAFMTDHIEAGVMWVAVYSHTHNISPASLSSLPFLSQEIRIGAGQPLNTLSVKQIKA